MKKVIMFAVILTWMGLGCAQSQCNSTRCMLIRQSRNQKVESNSAPSAKPQPTTVNYMNIP
jgi:hypothetical protein